MPKIVKLNESDLQKLVKRIIKEDDERRIGYGTEQIRNLQKDLAQYHNRFYARHPLL